MSISLPFLNWQLTVFLFTFILHPTICTQNQSKVKCLTYPNKTADNVISVHHEEPFFISCRINQRHLIKNQKWDAMAIDMKTFSCVLNHKDPTTKQLIG